MTFKHRFTYAAIMSFTLSFLMTAWVTWLNLGFIADFYCYWIKAFLSAWPAAACIAYLCGPGVQKITDRILAKI